MYLCIYVYMCVCVCVCVCAFECVQKKKNRYINIIVTKNFPYVCHFNRAKIIARIVIEQCKQSILENKPIFVTIFK